MLTRMSIDANTKLFDSIPGQLTKFVSQMWMEQKYIWLLNFLVLGMVHLALVFVLKSLLGGDRHILHCHVCIRRGEQHQGFSSQ